MEETARYLSRYLQLKLVRKPMRSKEIEGQIITQEGESIQFEQGVYETSDEGEIAFIEGRPEFKSGIIYRIPSDVKDLTGHEEEWRKDLETRERELAAREAAVAAREKGVNASEEGAKGDGLRANMKKSDLLAIAEKEGVEGLTEETKNGDIIDAIRAKRAETSGTGQSTGGEEGGAAF